MFLEHSAISGSLMFCWIHPNLWNSQSISSQSYPITVISASIMSEDNPLLSKSSKKKHGKKKKTWKALTVWAQIQIGRSLFPQITIGYHLLSSNGRLCLQQQHAAVSNHWRWQQEYLQGQGHVGREFQTEPRACLLHARDGPHDGLFAHFLFASASVFVCLAHYGGWSDKQAAVECLLLARYAFQYSHFQLRLGIGAYHGDGICPWYVAGPVFLSIHSTLECCFHWFGVLCPLSGHSSCSHAQSHVYQQTLVTNYCFDLVWLRDCGLLSLLLCRLCLWDLGRPWTLQSPPQVRTVGYQCLEYW